MLRIIARSLAVAAVATASLVPMTTPAVAWHRRFVIGIGIPAPVVLAPRVVFRARVLVPRVEVFGPAYAPAPHWVPGHYSWRGFWIPGHWV